MASFGSPLKRVAALATLGVAALVGTHTAKAQNAAGSPAYGFDPATNYLANSGGNGNGALNPDAYFKGFNGTSGGQNAAAVNPYAAKAQAIFATDANGNYTNPRVKQIVSDTIKLYNQAGPQYEHTPGLYAPMRQYFNGLKPGQDQDIALMVVNELATGTLSDHKSYPRNNSSLKTLEGDYALNLQTAESAGYHTIADRFRNSVLLEPVTSGLNAERLRVRTTIASMLNVAYPPRQTVALARSVGGQ